MPLCGVALPPAGADPVTSLPFGDGLATSGSCGDPSPLHFTGKQHDAETNLDDFDARYYSSGLARFMIPDWAAKATAVPYAEFGDPQSLNLYSYVRNNPVTAVDADGHDPDPDQGQGTPSPSDLPSDQSTPGLGAQPEASSQGKAADQKEWQAAAQKREEQVRGQLNAPKPGTPEYVAQVSGQVSAEMKAGNKVIAGMAIVESVGLGAVVGASATAATVAETAGTAARAGAQATVDAAGNFARTTAGAAQNTSLRVGVAIEATVPGGVVAASQFVQAAFQPTRAAPTTAGLLGLIANVTYKIIQH